MKSLISGATIAVALATSASAASISYQEFSYETYQSKTAKAAAIEDFDDPSSLSYSYAGGAYRGNGEARTYGELSGPIGTSVGTFSTYGDGVGSGNSCRRFRAPGSMTCSSIALQDGSDINGQGGITSSGGQALNSNDTLGFTWDVFLPGKALFTSVIFALRDAADAGAGLTVSVDGEKGKWFSKAASDDRQLWEIVFDKPMSAARILITHSKTNDSFSLDGAAVMSSAATPSVSAVPLPAGGLMLLGALGLSAGIARRRKAA
ncbi:hypothetical protein OCH239_20980 [Roseivivax halodurans JCM 10272]|uniref:PEP-CTERM protein-sorting domain-containing protein n=1 Tax=Roseivivax halodurans JCM 10272 TaxID=1449350 RepID=X7EFH2_9RHOB|nr:hypothetical protein [Roseivivax halodurans]ETX14829.1 hypothetical protein OCH239_20980 [Roseivivax halodurans JCM 10272]